VNISKGDPDDPEAPSPAPTKSGTMSNSSRFVSGTSSTNSVYLRPEWRLMMIQILKMIRF